MLLLLLARLLGDHKDRADKQRTNHPHWIKRHEFTIGRIGRSGFLIDVNTKAQHACVLSVLPVAVCSLHRYGSITCNNYRMGSTDVKCTGNPVNRHDHV